MKKITLLTLLFCGSTFAQIINTAPYILTVDELKAWTQGGPTASPDLISSEPLATRFTNPATQFNPTLTNDMQIAYLPDGMNNFGNYSGEQSQFNLYNFTHWAYIDKLVWFGGTSSQTIQLPSAPWANAAHRNGVKIFGNVFFAPTVFGGSTATLQSFLEQDGSGQFVAIPKMIAIMQYYHFDGWFINQETATTAVVAEQMRQFVRDLTAQAEAVGKEVMWYDAMRLTGAVGWQNRLNQNNSPFVQDDQDANGTFETRVSSNIFINFFWGASFPPMSRTRAATIGRSQFEVFTGADIWPGRNQGNFETNGNLFMGNLHENATTPYTSLGLFAPNCIYNNPTYTNFNNDPTDYATFYAAENRMFAGDDKNPATVDATGWKGFSNWIPETSVIADAPFFTHFSTGHGTKKFNLGLPVSAESWHDMNQQDILPTWQFAFSENGLLSAQWDFDNAVEKGNSLKISGVLPADTPVDLMLFKTKLNPNAGSAFNIGLTYKSLVSIPNLKILVVYADEPNQKYELALGGDLAFNNWYYKSVNTAPQREIAMVGLRFQSPFDVSNYEINIGELLIQQTLLGVSENASSNPFVTVTYPNDDQIGFTINWPDASKIDYTVFDLNGRKVKSGTIRLNQTTKYQFDAKGLQSGTYIVKFADEKNTKVTQKIFVK